MAELLGQTLGHYRIVEKIGAGGMGEVYRARDERLDRDVAIKVLPEAVAADPERLARFEREAKLLASLSHQNIATLYGLDEHDGVRFLAMELAEGETLADRIARGPLPEDDVVAIALQIASGLEAAHERGIIHRDLKPANVMVSPEGQVKILDFGLAKAWLNKLSDVDLAESPTITAEMTASGVLLGTAAYMSPEQAKGKRFDKRTDIWAFGVVLYEMITGARAFTGDTTTEILAAIIKEDPDWDALPIGVSTPIRRLLRRCLAKDPRDRLHDIADARIELEESIRDPAPVSRVDSLLRSDTSSPRRRVVSTVGVFVSAGIIGLASWLLMTSEPTDPSVRRFNLQPPPGVEVHASESTATLAISPNGEWVVFEGHTEGHRQLYIRSIKEPEAKPVPGTEGADTPFFSPDGTWLGFTSDDLLQKVPIGGGELLPICPVEEPSLRGASWGDDGEILFQDGIGGLWQVPADGGDRMRVTAADREARGEIHRWPQHLPGGQAALFSISTGFRASNNRIAVVALNTGDYHTLLTRGSHPRFIQPGYIVYSRLGTLYAVPFNPKRLEITGDPRPVLEDVYYWSGSGYAAFAVSDSGSLVYEDGAPQVVDSELVWLDRDGNIEPVATEHRPYWGKPAISPDGSRLAVEIDSGPEDSDIWMYEIDRDVWTRLTFTGGMTGGPLWTPDGKELVFLSDQTGFPRIYSLAVDGSGDLEELTRGPGLGDWPFSISNDGKVLAFCRQMAPAQWDILMLPLKDRDRTPQPFVSTPDFEAEPAFSPDGAWVAYRSKESGRHEIYVRPYPGPGPKVKVSSEGGVTPQWNPNGREIFYRSGRAIWSVPVEFAPDFSAGRPRPLFDADYLGGIWADAFDVSPDGQRFLLIKYPEEIVEPLRLVYVPNWTEELKRLVPRAN